MLVLKSRWFVPPRFLKVKITPMMSFKHLRIFKTRKNIFKNLKLRGIIPLESFGGLIPYPPLAETLLPLGLWDVMPAR
jgi:hypothetical protein